MEGPLRACGTSRTRAQILPAVQLEARDLAREILSAASGRADALLADAERQSEEIRAAARAAGRQDGLAEAQRVLVEVQRARARLLEDVELNRTAADLALEMVSRVLGASWAADPVTWARACAAAAEPLRRSRALRLHVAPASGEAVRLALASEIGAGALAVIEDGTMGEEGCIAVSECGRVDARLSTILTAFREAIHGATAPPPGPAAQRRECPQRDDPGPNARGPAPPPAKARAHG